MIGTGLPLVVKLIVFALAISPQLILNLRTGAVKNSYNALIFVAGLVFALLEREAGSNPASLLVAISWLAAALIVVMALHAAGIVPGGIGKTLIALMPWFSIADYLIVVVAGFMIFGLIGLLLVRRGQPGLSIPAVPVFATTGAALFLWQMSTAQII